MEHVRLYLKYRNLYQGQLTRARQLTERFVQLFDGVHPEVGKGIYNYLTQKGVKPSDMIPREKGQSQEDYETLLKRAAATKRLIRNVGRELVKAGLLEENVFEANKDSYLPRIYLKYLIGDEGSQQLSNHGRLDLNYLKKRKDIPGWMREVFMGQIYEPGLLVPMMVGRSQRDIALHSFMEKIAGNQDWVAQATLLEYPVPDTENPNDYQRYTEDNPELGVAAGDPVTIKITPQYAIKEAERIENTLDKYDPSVRGSAAFLAANLKMFANDHLAQTRTKFDTKHYKQIPDSARYGHLRGAWVRKEIANDLMGALSIDQGDDYLQWMINKAQHVTGRWKVHKVAMNPPTIARNLMSNAMLLQMSGMPLFTPSKYNVAKMMFVDSIGEIRNNGKYYKIFTKYGGQESTFSNQELTRLTREFRRQYTGKGGNALYMLHKISDTVYGTAGDFYQLLETMGKVAKIKYEMEVNGLAEDDAMIEANKWLFDYSHVPRTVETLRKIPFGIPFLTFYYKATARVAETMIRYPHRMLPWVSVHYAMYAAAMAMMDDVDWEDLTQARMALPYFMRERGGMLPMPFRDANGKIQFLDMSYIYPWGMPMNILLQAKQGDTAGVLTQFGLGGSPILQQFAGHLTGYHPFYQKPIYDGMYLEKAGFRVNEADKLAAYLKFAWNIWAPGPMTVDPGNPFYKMKLAVEGEATGYGDLPPTIGQATARMGGLNLYPVDAKEDAMQNIGYMTYIIGEYRRKMTNKIANARNDREREKLTREMNSQLEQLTEDLNEYKQRAGID